MQQKTTCPYCGVGCGVDVRVENNAVVELQGDNHHPANQGRLCVKGSRLADTLGSRERLLYPQIDGQRVDWNQALDRVSDTLRRTIMAHGPDSVAFYLSGQLLTEDYYVANKLMKGFIGSANVDTNSRLCMSSAVVGHKRAFGADAVPCSYEDIDHAELIVLVGSNAAWNHPILFQRILARKAADSKVRLVVIDPRRTASCEAADLHLPLKPGSDVALFNGLFDYLVEHNCIDSDFISDYTEGFEAAWAAARRAQNPAQACDLDADLLQQFYSDFARSGRVLTLFSQGVNQSSSGVDNANSIINCHLIRGQIGNPGCGPFSITGQPNAMGGREVGGLANQLAAHMGFDNQADIDRVQRFWQAPNMAKKPGLMAVELFDAIERGQIKAVWIMGTNPVVSLPDSDRIAAALARCESVIVSDCVAHSDTLEYADIHLPALGWSEKDGTVTNSERRISRQRSLLPPSAEAKPDWWIISQVAQRLGYGAAFDYHSPVEIFREHAALSGYENGGTRAFDIGALAEISEQQYQQLVPTQWPITPQSPDGQARLFADGRFYTGNGRARLIAVDAAEPLQQPNAQYPWVVNSGRIRDQWHTMTRTGLAPQLFQHRQEPFVELHPDDAGQQGIADGDLVELQAQGGRYLGRVRLDSGLRRGNLFVPMHWNRQFSGQARSGVLMRPVTDPLSGQPESKHGVAAIRPYNSRWQACLVSREIRTQLPVDYWSRTPLSHAQLYRLADQQPMEDWLGWCRVHLGDPGLWLEDSGSEHFRAAGFEQGRLSWLLLVSPSGALPSTEWLEQLFAQDRLEPNQRRQLLSARDSSMPDKGALVCSCYQIGQNQIEQAVIAGCDSLGALGEQLKCGTNCGSCVPELQQLVEGIGVAKVGEG